ncbi:MAG TPA: YceI family protein [Flavisolibacter sp.]|nr:YceI family protein [Flavisolibacter sp.]
MNTITRIIFLLVLSFPFFCSGQGKFFTKTGRIDFFSKAPMEDIEATNKTVTAVLDTKTGNVQFAVLMKSFEFDKKLMQQHFNENYVESDKYPKGEFKGTVTNNGEVNYAKDGSYTAKIKGKLTIHGVTKDIETTGIIKVSGGKVETNAVFNILLSDYNIKIPAVVKDKLSNTIKITVDCKLDPLKA